MADGGKGPPSTSAMLPATNTDDAPPTRTHSSLYGTTATSSPAGDASAGAMGSAPEAPKQNNCANCGARAKLLCSGCLEGLDGNGDPSSTYYCIKKCQEDHRKTHISECKLAIDRRHLFRIGALVQCAFYTGTKAMWYDEILELRKLKPMVEDDDAVVRDVEHASGASDEARKEVQHAVGDDSVEVRVREFGADEDVIKVKVRAKKRVAWEDGVEVHLWRYKKHDGPDFPEFPAGHLPGYDGALEERDEQSVLAASASNAAIVCGLLSDLVRGE